MGLEVGDVQKSLSDRALWIERGVLLVLILIVIGFWTWDHRDKVHLAKDLADLRVENAGLVAEKDAKQKDLDRAAEALLSKDKSWKQMVEDLQKALGEKPKVVEVIKWRSKTSDASDAGDTTPRTCPEIPATPTTPAQPAMKTIVAEGDKGHVEVGEITYGTKDGSTVLTASALCFRETPSGFAFWHTTIEKAPPVAIKIPNEDKYRWGGGSNFDFGDYGFLVTPKVMFPPFEANLLLFRAQVETELGLGIGTQGHWALHTGIGGRFK
jgi:hypothetical protein